MEIRKVKQVFGAVVMLSTALFVGNATAEAVVVEDINFDSIPDVVVSGEDGQLTTFLGKGDGTFGKAHESGKKRVKTPHEHTANIMKEKDAQVALTLNKNLSFDVLGVNKGERVKPCKKGEGNDCHFDRDKIFAQETFTITIVEGSCCAYISGGSSTYKFCTPEWPLSFVNSISGENCPRNE